MQSNAGTIKGSNLCAEIVEYTSTDEAAVCVIGSIVLHSYVKNGEYDFDDLRKHVKILTKNLDRSIDVMSYAIPEAKTSNMRRRPVGVGCHCDSGFCSKNNWQEIKISQATQDKDDQNGNQQP
jgi:ribonucleotide reductase alpha subunit